MSRNIFGELVKSVIAVMALFAMSSSSESLADIVISTGSDWKATASPSSDWNTNAGFDDSAWANATVVGAVLPNTIWLAGGPKTVSFRKVFEVPDGVLAATLRAWFDDDGDVWLNGTQVINDRSGNADNEFTGLNVLSYLQAGQNLIAATALDYLGNQLFASTLSVTVVPEPSTYAMTLAGLACGGFSMWRRRKRA